MPSMLDYTRKENQLLTKKVCTRFYTLIFRRETFLPKQSRSAAAFLGPLVSSYWCLPARFARKKFQKIPNIFLKITEIPQNTLKIVKEFRRFQKKIAKMLQIPPSEREPGGASLILGLPLYFVLRKEPHMKVSLKSKNVSNFFSKLGKIRTFSAEILKTFEDEQRSSRCRIFENRSQILRSKS